MDDLKITLVQTNLAWESKDKNLEIIRKRIFSSNEQTDLIILPEMFSTGFTMNANIQAEEMEGKTFQWMKNISKEKNCVITGSIIIKENNKYYNRLIWMKPDGFNYYNKRHLFSLAEEEKTYTGGSGKITETIKGWKILPLVCYDLRFPVWSRRTKTDDYDLLLYVANWPERRVYAWDHLLIARGIENQCYVAGVNRVGSDGHDVYHSGHSAVIDFKGENVGKADPGKEEIISATLSANELLEFRKHFAFLNDGDKFKIH